MQHKRVSWWRRFRDTSGIRFQLRGCPIAFGMLLAGRLAVSVSWERSPAWHRQRETDAIAAVFGITSAPIFPPNAGSGQTTLL